MTYIVSSGTLNPTIPSSNMTGRIACGFTGVVRFFGLGKREPIMEVWGFPLKLNAI